MLVFKIGEYVLRDIKKCDCIDDFFFIQFNIDYLLLSKYVKVKGVKGNLYFFEEIVW